MRRYTTPTIAINVTGETFEDCDIFVTLKQGNSCITKSGSDVDVTVTGEDTCTLTVSYTQEETAALSAGSCNLQIRWVTPSGRASASPIKSIPLNDVLYNAVIRYGE